MHKSICDSMRFAFDRFRCNGFATVVLQQLICSRNFILFRFIYEKELVMNEKMDLADCTLNGKKITKVDDLPNLSLPSSQMQDENSRRLFKDKAPQTASHLRIMTSTLPRAIETVAPFAERGIGVESYSSLNLLNKGSCHGSSIADLRTSQPALYDEWQKDPFSCRFPGGESYEDVMNRLESLIVDIEGYEGPILIVSHLSALQVLYNYFQPSLPIEQVSI